MPEASEHRELQLAASKVVLDDESSLRVSEEEEEPTIFGGDDFELHLLMYQQS